MNRPPKLCLRPHDLIKTDTGWRCSSCCREWKYQPKHECPGLPVYHWGEAPADLFTADQINQKRLIPGEPRGLIFYSKAMDNYLRLYRVEDCTEKKPLSDAQKAALDKLRFANTREAREQRRRKPIQDSASALLQAGFVVIDTETCGLDPFDGIVEIAVADHTGEILIDTRLNPGHAIPADATDIHGITDADVRDAPTFHDIYPQLAAVLNGRTWVIYNADFDTGFLEVAAMRNVLPEFQPVAVHCAMLAYAKWVGEWNHYRRDWRWQSLDHARDCHNLAPDLPAHSALGDALTTLALIKFLAQPEPEQETV